MLYTTNETHINYDNGVAKNVETTWGLDDKHKPVYEAHQLLKQLIADEVVCPIEDDGIGMAATLLSDFIEHNSEYIREDIVGISDIPEGQLQ